MTLVVDVALSKPVSDLVLKERMEQTREISAFLSKYPDANVQYYSDGQVRTIDYFVSTSKDSDGDGDSGDESRGLQINIVVDEVSGEVYKMIMSCSWEGGYQGDIVDELAKENCLGLPSEEELVAKGSALGDVKDFLAEYPEAQISASRKSMVEVGFPDEFPAEGHFAVVDYSFKKTYPGVKDKLGKTVYNEARLSVVMDAQAIKVLQTIVACDTGFAGGPGIVTRADDTPAIEFLRLFKCASSEKE